MLQFAAEYDCRSQQAQGKVESIAFGSSTQKELVLHLVGKWVAHTELSARENS